MKLRALLVLLVLLIVCAEGHAEKRRKAVALADNCAGLADVKLWTPQEVFVWKSVCAGETADFNVEEYGGVLDPQDRDDWPKNRILRATFLEEILTKEKYRRALTRLGVRIEGAWFMERIQLENAELKHELWLDKSVLQQGANLAGLRTTHRISFDGSLLNATLDLERAQIGGDLMFRSGHVDSVDLHDAIIEGRAMFGGSTVRQTLNLDGLAVKSSLMLNKAQFADLILRSANITTSTATRLPGTCWRHS